MHRIWLFRSISTGIIIIPLAFAAFGCGSVTDSGSGTGTLFTSVEISGEPGKSELTADLKRDGEEVSGAEVIFKDEETGVELTAEPRSQGAYKAEADTYLRVVSIRITAGEDHLTATLEGPWPHVITEPLNNAILHRSEIDTLKVAWDADDNADRVVVALENVPDQEIDGDPRTTTVSLGGLRDGTQSIKVARENSVELSGGASGSRMMTRYEVDNRFTLER